MRKLFVLAAAAAAAAAVAKKLKLQQAQPVWHTPDTDAASADDVAGASPDEALADAAEEPHRATTPDEPLTETAVDPT